MGSSIRDSAVVFLDVDGVLGAAVTTFEAGTRATVPESIIARVQRVAARGSVVWATSWGIEVRESLRVALGLPGSTASVAMTRAGDSHASKRAAIERFLRLNEPADGWKAAVWVDDRIGVADVAWARELRHPLELVAVNADLLLTDDDVDRVLAAIEGGSDQKG